MQWFAEGLLARSLLVAVLFLTVAPLAAAQRQKELQAQGRMLEALQVQLLKLPNERVPSSRRGELAAMLTEMQWLTGEGSVLRNDLQGIEGEMRGYCGEDVAWRSEYGQWIRLAAVGDKFPELVTANGRRYNEVEIRRVTESGLEIRHRNGTAGLRFEQLPEQWQERFFYIKSEEPRQTEEERRAWIAARRAEIEEQTIATRVEELRVIFAEQERARAAEEEAKEKASRLHSARLHPSKGLRRATLNRARLGARWKLGISK